MKILVINDNGDTILESHVERAELKVEEEQKDFIDWNDNVIRHPTRYVMTLSGTLVDDSAGKYMTYYEKNNHQQVLFTSPFGS